MMSHANIETLRALQIMLYQCNSYVTRFQVMATHANDRDNLRMVLKASVQGLDTRHYNFLLLKCHQVEEEE